MFKKVWQCSICKAGFEENFQVHSRIHNNEEEFTFLLSENWSFISSWINFNWSIFFQVLLIILLIIEESNKFENETSSRYRQQRRPRRERPEEEPNRGWSLLGPPEIELVRSGMYPLCLSPLTKNACIHCWGSTYSFMKWRNRSI